MNRLELLRVFSVAAQTGSFRQAALKLGVSPQAVTRAVAQLEQTWGELLFHRSSRQVRLTAFGEQLAESARAAVLGVDRVFEKDTQSTDNASMGVVRVAVPGSLGRRCVAEVLAPLTTQHPGLLLDLRVSDQIADAVNEKIDVGVRIGRLRDSRFVARKAAALPLVVVATPALLQRTFEPDAIEEMAELPITALIDRNTGRPWPWVFRGRAAVCAEVGCVRDGRSGDRECGRAGRCWFWPAGSTSGDGAAASRPSRRRAGARSTGPLARCRVPHQTNTRAAACAPGVRPLGRVAGRSALAANAAVKAGPNCTTGLRSDRKSSSTLAPFGSLRKSCPVPAPACCCNLYSKPRSSKRAFTAFRSLDVNAM